MVGDDMRANTAFPTAKGELLAEVRLRVTGPDTFTLTQRTTADKGRTWAPLYEGMATRRRR